MTIDLMLQLVTSLLTVTGVYLNGDKNIWGPRVGVVSNMFWWLSVLHGELWGLLPLQVVMTVLVIRMLVKWERDRDQ